MNKIYFFLFLLTILSNANSQRIQGICGTGLEDNAIIKQRMLDNREAWAGKTIPRGGAPVYVPLTYWLVAKNDGTGRLATKSVIDNICCLNEIYSEFNISFYLKGINFPNNTFIYDDPISTLGAAYINQIMQANKNAINIFVANVAKEAEPEVLAFYTPNGDYVVSGRLHLNGDCPKIAHEIGHYFSLAHTFYGWEETKYDEITMTCTKPTPQSIVYAGKSVLVEYVDRNKASATPGKFNCEVAADGFCDTPADYNLGLGHTGCVYAGCAKDPDNVPLNPSEINYMGYFIECIEEFTPDQKAAITIDLLSTKRNYLRTVNYTPKPEVTEQVKYQTPTAAAPPTAYDVVNFNWEDVPNAEFYLFDIAENIGFNLNPRSFILKHSDTTLTNLKKNTNYHWRVTPYNSNSYCLKPSVVSFKTPNWTVANEDIDNPDISTHFVQEASDVYLVINAIQNENITLHIMNINGQIIYSDNHELLNGNNKIALNHLAPGFFLFKIISNDKSQNTGKFIKF